jgi:hypothetical protein
MPVHIDDARLNAAGLCHRKLETGFRRGDVAVWRKQELDRVPA